MRDKIIYSKTITNNLKAGSKVQGTKSTFYPNKLAIIMK